jgi:hypothetical protein
LEYFRRTEANENYCHEYKEVSKNKVNKHYDAKYFLLILLYVQHMDGRWYTSDLCITTIDMYVFVLP